MNPQHPNEPLLEAILTNQDSHAKDHSELMEHMIVQNEKNNPSELLEAQLIKADEIVQTLKNKPEVQKIKIVTDESELADNFFRMLRGQKGEKGDKGDSIKGDKGDKGEDSTVQGPKGERGEQGPKGDNGLNGKDGKDGKDGKNGKDGLDGRNGKDGEKGEQGPKGNDGKSLSQEDIDRIGKKLKDNESNLLWVNNGAVKEIRAGTGVTITGDPQTPTISASGGGTGTVDTIVAGTGISVNSTDPLNPVVTNSAPDQTVSITAGTNITSVTGTYPNFTINAATQSGGDVTKVGTPVNNQIGVWTGDGTLEGDAALTFDTATDTLATTSITATTVTANLIGNVTGNVSGSSGSTTGNAATVTTNANLTGPVTSVGNATAIADAALSIAKTSGLQTALDGKQSTITFGTGVQTALGVNIGTAGSPLVNGGVLGTPSSGTVTNLTGTASININGTVGATTPTTGSFTTVTTSGNIELGNASDTTLSRAAAGDLAVEGVSVLTTSNIKTVTNKRITQRVTTITSSATPTVNTDDCDAVTITALAAAITSMTTNLSGTPTDFQRLVYRIKDNGTARAITWGSSFAARGVALPTTTVISKYLTVGFMYNSTTSTWDCVASAQEA